MMNCRAVAETRSVLSVIAILIGVSPAIAATRVDLVIDEPKPPRSVAWPITTGVPFPRGALMDVRTVPAVGQAPRRRFGDTAAASP